MKEEIKGNESEEMGMDELFNVYAIETEKRSYMIGDEISVLNPYMLNPLSDDFAESRKMKVEIQQIVPITEDGPSHNITDKAMLLCEDGIMITIMNVTRIYTQVILDDDSEDDADNEENKYIEKLNDKMKRNGMSFN